MKLFGLPLALLLIAGAARAQDTTSHRWTTRNVLWAAASTTLLVIDWGQTRQGAANGSGEFNPVLGHNPSRAAVNRYEVGVIAANLFVAAVLPTKARSLMLMLMTGVEVFAVGNNVLAGVRLRLPL